MKYYSTATEYGNGYIVRDHEDGRTMELFYGPSAEEGTPARWVPNAAFQNRVRSERPGEWDAYDGDNPEHAAWIEVLIEANARRELEIEKEVAERRARRRSRNQLTGTSASDTPIP
ncbi:MAG: hypothetical protein Q4G50_13145 [Corynebacterium sp.]|uniref:hypothetical protein n=1 Tax=Corynebacterium sp. TaxID=1720 RepID=UPI0026DFBEB6|nr:hypothetical protein [Corynebacterium sp.]MDO5670930.1 hypothetical protein [Corynebacterium sp.]